MRISDELLMPNGTRACEMDHQAIESRDAPLMTSALVNPSARCI